MVSRLDNIIRLRQWELDEERRHLASLQGEFADFVHQLEMIEVEVAEQARSSDLEVFSTTVGAYMDGVKNKQILIHTDMEKLEQKIAVQQDKVAEGFRELKTFEIARDQELKRVHLAEMREEQQEFDELAIQKHSRQDNDVDTGIL